MKKYLKKLTDNFKILAIFMVAFTVLFMANIFNLPVIDVIGQIIKQTITSYSPTEDLFEDSSDIFFVATPSGINVKGLSLPTLTLPTKGASWTKEQEEYVFSSFLSVAVKASGKGVVTEVGYEDNKKYIIVLHSGNITTKYKNVNVLGVCTGDRVKKGDLIATIKLSNPLYFSVMQNSEPYSNFSVKGDSIVWQ